jgi:hypothetical protein
MKTLPGELGRNSSSEVRSSLQTNYCFSTRRKLQGPIFTNSMAQSFVNGFIVETKTDSAK